MPIKKNIRQYTYNMLTFGVISPLRLVSIFMVVNWWWSFALSCIIVSNMFWLCDDWWVIICKFDPEYNFVNLHFRCLLLGLSWCSIYICASICCTCGIQRSELRTKWWWREVPEQQGSYCSINLILLMVSRVTSCQVFRQKKKRWWIPYFVL